MESLASSGAPKFQNSLRSLYYTIMENRELWSSYLEWAGTSGIRPLAICCLRPTQRQGDGLQDGVKGYLRTAFSFFNFMSRVRTMSQLPSGETENGRRQLKYLADRRPAKQPDKWGPVGAQRRHNVWPRRCRKLDGHLDSQCK